jgi:hypothetical protein
MVVQCPMAHEQTQVAARHRLAVDLSVGRRSVIRQRKDLGRGRDVVRLADQQV